MGRLKKYNTIEEKQLANSAKSKRYYWKNKNRIDESMKQKYHDKKNGTDLRTLQKDNE